MLLPDDAIRIAAMPDTRAAGRQPTWLPHELQVDGTDLVDRSGSPRLPLLEVFWLPIFISSARTFDPQPEQDHAPRLTIGHTVLAREAWNVPAGDVPQRAQDIAAFTRDLGIARHAFVKSPLERKPMYLDTDSPVLARILCRHARHAAAESSQPHPLHRDAPHPRPRMAKRRRRQPLRLRTAPRRPRQARTTQPSKPSPTTALRPAP